MKEIVVVKKVTEISNDLEMALTYLNVYDIRDGDRLVIKPNLCDFRPSWEGGTTDPKVVEAFIKFVQKKANPRITIVESNHAVADAEDEFERMGYKELAEKLDVALVNLSKDKRYEVALDGYFFKSLDVPETLLNATKIISIAKLKTHSQQKITCSMKNLFGLLPTKSKAKYHPFLNEVLADLNEFYRPYLCIIDGIVGMEGFGPSDGVKKELGIIICGKNPVAVDAVAARVMGFDPASVPHLRFAERNGLGSTQDIEILGDVAIDSIQRFAFIPHYAYWIYRFSFFIEKMGTKISNTLTSISKFVSQISIGFIVFKDGQFSTTSLGTLSRKMAIIYVKGLILRPLVLINMKIRRIL